MGNPGSATDTDHWNFRNWVPENDCIISPMSEYYFKGSDIPSRSRFRIQVPHILQDIHLNRNKIKVQHRQNGIFSDAKPLIRRQDLKGVYYKVNEKYVEILSPHFCQFFITTEGINCCSGRATMLAFSMMERRKPYPFVKAAVYFGSAHHVFNDYRQVQLLTTSFTDILIPLVLNPIHIANKLFFKVYFNNVTIYALNCVFSQVGSSKQVTKGTS